VRDHQKIIVDKRLKGNSGALNKFVKGDFVLFHAENDYAMKLSLQFKGPWEVIQSRKDEVQCRHLSTHIVEWLKLDRLKPFFGDKASAERAAMLDADEYVVTEVRYFIGDPVIRTSLEFEVHYADGDWQWRTWSRELAKTKAFEEFCVATPGLSILLMTANESMLHVTKLSKMVIAQNVLSSWRYVQLRHVNEYWYSITLLLPNYYSTEYVIKCQFISWGNEKRTRVILRSEVLDYEFIWSNYEVQVYGVNSVLRDSFVLVDEDMVAKFPKLRDIKKLKSEESISRLRRKSKKK